MKVENGAKNSKTQRRLRRPDPRPARAAATPIPTSRSTSRTSPIGHEASVSRDRRGAALLPDEPRPLRGRSQSPMIVNGFIEPLVKELPMEYAVEMNRLIQLQMEGSVG